ncbi:HupE/UreJ family protein [Rhizobium leguminosarum]|uniref:HupE/UreJ family protein n=1 Tax=Rhizobium leguminosarum TaxID=384 RepID=UPI001C94A546|nr:HupE/UreJ family protein [Rhizobium leguminosarum]MBY5333735.1 HupE/UreJ family protein [Rhizobium leguminosarum]
MIRIAATLWILMLPLLASIASAHELRPAYLDMREVGENTFVIVWKVPARGEMRLSLNLRLPETCKPEAEPVRTLEAGAYKERWTARCGVVLQGQVIAVDGLDATLTDALARLSYLDGTTEVARLTPENPSFAVVGTQSSLEVAATYFRLGLEHILSGIDHLLFVLALILLIHDRWMLLKTITAFTVAHSITLSGAGLGYFSLSQKPVEAVIALSIAFVASELLKIKPGDPRLSERYPWLVAFAFGLLHGFGFSGALKEIGLPQVDVPLALLTFNLGVEAGQLVFVAAALAGWAATSAFAEVPAQPARTLAAYFIGVVATVWLIERLVTLGT